MGRMLFRVKRPSDDGFDKTYVVPHRCYEGTHLARAGDRDADLLEFWPFQAGAGMPTGVAFPVEAQEPCRACAKRVVAWFEWQDGLISI